MKNILVRRKKQQEKDLQSELQAASEKLQVAINSETKEYDSCRFEMNTWSDRAGKATSRLDHVTPEGIDSIQALIAQAERYVEVYSSKMKQHENRLKEMREGLAKINEALTQMATMENILELESNLRSMEATYNIPLHGPTEIFDRKEVSRMVHHAQALVELKLS